MKQPTGKITYVKGGYRYQLTERAVLKLHAHPRMPDSITAGFIHPSWTIHDDADSPYVFAAAGYAWDGPSGIPKWIASSGLLVKWLLAASLKHDIGYQSLRLSKLPWNEQQVLRLYWDTEFRLDIEMNAPKWVARLAFKLVRKFGDFAADPKSRKRVRTIKF